MSVINSIEFQARGEIQRFSHKLLQIPDQTREDTYHMRFKDYVGVGTVVLASIIIGFFILWTEPRQSASASHGHGHGASSHDKLGHAVEAHKDAHHEELGHGGEQAGHDHNGSAQGPHGGRLFKDGHFEVEVVITEKGVPPRFRVYCYEDDKPVDPKKVSVSIELSRLGDRITQFPFEPKGDFLHSDRIVQEPHSFDAKVNAHYGGRKYEWKFSQIEARTRLVRETLETMGIRIETAGPKRIRSVVDLPGEIFLNTDRVCRVVPRVAGVISKFAKNLGDEVKAGETVAVVDSRELADARSRYLVLLNREDLARINFERTKRLWNDKVSPEKEFLDMQKAFEEAKIERLAAGQKLRAMGLSKEDLRKLREEPESSMIDYALKAPFDGVVIAKDVSQGQWVEEKTDILRIADLSTVWVDITIYAENLNSVRVGQNVTVRSDSPDLEAEGVVSYVGPLVGAKSRTAKARVVIENPQGKWRPGMFVSVRVVKEETLVPVAVRQEAIQILDRFGDAVFVRYGEDLEVRPITIGRADEEHVEVLKGLSPGEKYASGNSFLIKAELAKGGLSHNH